MVKFTKKELDTIRDFTPQRLKGHFITEFLERERLGYFQKNGANWRYFVDLIRIDKDNTFIVVSEFGKII